jgi:hypothetical protein
MKRGKPTVVGRHRVSIRVLLPETDYHALAEIAEQERTDISTLVRRAIARYFFVPEKRNTINQAE